MPGSSTAPDSSRRRWEMSAKRSTFSWLPCRPIRRLTTLRGASSGLETEREVPNEIPVVRVRHRRIPRLAAARDYLAGAGGGALGRPVSRRDHGGSRSGAYRLNL